LRSNGSSRKPYEVRDFVVKILTSLNMTISRVGTAGMTRPSEHWIYAMQ
jgi:hypothetical protein